MPCAWMEDGCVPSLLHQGERSNVRVENLSVQIDYDKKMTLGTLEVGL